MRDRNPASAGATSSPRRLGELPEELLLLGPEVGGHVDDRSHDEVAARPALEVRHAPPAQPELLARRRAARDHEVLGAVERVELEVGAEGRLGEGDRQLAVEVEAVAGEALVGLRAHVDVQVAVGAAPRARRRRGRSRRSVEPVSTPAGMSTV